MTLFNSVVCYFFLGTKSSLFKRKCNFRLTVISLNRAVISSLTTAAEKAKAEDAAREAENLRFMQEMAKKTAISEKMRKDAGSVPFEPDAGVNADRK